MKKKNLLFVLLTLALGASHDAYGKCESARIFGHDAGKAGLGAAICVGSVAGILTVIGFVGAYNASREIARLKKQQEKRKKRLEKDSDQQSNEFTDEASDKDDSESIPS